MEKQALRDEITARLRTLDVVQKAEWTKQMTNYLINSDLWQEAETIGITISRGFEWDTGAIIRQGWKEDKRIVVPKCYPKTNQLKFYEFTNYAQLENVYLELQEPNPNLTEKVRKEAIDLIIVPGLVFDRKGYRIGFGGGYYDRYLADYPNETISLIGSFQIVDEVPKESFDIPVQGLITENGFVQ